VRHIFDFHLHAHKAELESLAQYHTLRDLAQRGLAFHHSGVLPALKEIVELLFSRGLIRALFATETFAVGLNMPTKTAVFLDVRKYDDAVEGMRPLRPDEYTQMAGRAGRRGKDPRGLALYLPAHPPLEPGDMGRMIAGALAPLHSRLLLHYDFVRPRAGGARACEGRSARGAQEAHHRSPAPPPPSSRRRSSASSTRAASPSTSS
jgi:superfamily II RNA helicase